MRSADSYQSIKDPDEGSYKAYESWCRKRARELARERLEEELEEEDD